MSLRRYVRTVILLLIVTSFVITAVLFLALVISDDSTRLCRGELDQVRSVAGDVKGHSSSVLRQLNLPALASNFNDKLPVRS